MGAAVLAVAPGSAPARAEDGTWFRQNDRRVRRVVASPNFAVDRTLYAGVASGDEVAHGVLKSTDRGATWAPSNGGLDQRMRALDLLAVAGPAPAGTLVLPVIRRTYGTGEQPAGIFVSTDGGASWTPRLEHTRSWDVLAAAVSPGFADDGVLLLGMRATGIVRSEDGGRSLQPANTGLTTLYPYGIAVTPTFAQDGTVFVATEGGGLFRSTDRGRSWVEANQGLDELYLYSVAVSPAYGQDRTVMVGTGQGTVFTSTDGGRSWAGSGRGIRDQRLTTLAFSPDFARNRTAYVGSESGGLFRSTDAGASWARIDAPFGAEVFSILPLPGPDGETLVVSVSDGGIWVYDRPGMGSTLAATATARAEAPTPTPRATATPVAAPAASAGGGLQCLVYVVVGPIGWLTATAGVLTVRMRLRASAATGTGAT